MCFLRYCTGHVAVFYLCGFSSREDPRPRSARFSRGRLTARSRFECLPPASVLQVARMALYVLVWTFLLGWCDAYSLRILPHAISSTRSGMPPQMSSPHLPSFPPDQTPPPDEFKYGVGRLCQTNVGGFVIGRLSGEPGPVMPPPMPPPRQAAGPPPAAAQPQAARQPPPPPAGRNGVAPSIQRGVVVRTCTPAHEFYHGNGNRKWVGLQ